MSNCWASNNFGLRGAIACVLWSIAVALSAAEPPVTAAAFTPAGDLVVVGSQGGISVRRLPRLREERKLSSTLRHVHDLTFSPDGTLLAAVGGSPAEAGTVHLYRWPEGDLAQEIQLGEDVLYRLSWMPDGSAFAVAGPDEQVSVLDTHGTVLYQVQGHSQSVTAVIALPENKLVSSSRDHTLRVWEVSNDDPIRTLNNHTNEVTAIALRPGVSEAPYVIASAGQDRTIRFWWPVRGRLMRFAKLPSAALDIAWTSDGTSLLAACEDGRLRVIDPDTVEITAELAICDGWLYTVAASPTGQIFAGGTNGVMQVLTISDLKVAE